MLYPHPVNAEPLATIPYEMVAIAECESGGTQFKENGTLVRDYLTGDHVGLYQISLRLHNKKALALGYNIRTTPGNIGYALHLYHTQGTQPWQSSKRCWDV